MAILYDVQGEWKLADDYYHETIDTIIILEDKSQDDLSALPIGISNQLLFLTGVSASFRRGDYVTAIHYEEEALALVEDHDRLTFSIYMNLIEAYIKALDIDAAEKYGLLLSQFE